MDKLSNQIYTYSYDTTQWNLNPNHKELNNSFYLELLVWKIKMEPPELN